MATSRKSGRGLTERDLVIWRFLRDQGGWWTVREIGSALPCDTWLRGRLLRLVELGHAKRKLPSSQADSVSVSAWGVTVKCTAPPGETLDPAAEVAA